MSDIEVDDVAAEQARVELYQCLAAAMKTWWKLKERLEVYVNPGSACEFACVEALEALYAAGQKAERSACAGVADAEEEAWQDGESNATTCRMLSVAIRARGDGEPDIRDVEIATLRKSQDELADEVSKLRDLLDAHGFEVPTP